MNNEKTIIWCRRIALLLVAAIGIGIIVLGAGVCEGADERVRVDAFTFTPDNYNVDYASFGADFYTYIYGASDTIVDELDEVNSGISTIVKGQTATNGALKDLGKLISSLIRGCGMVVIAIGLAVVAYDIPKLAEAFLPRKKEQPTKAEEEVTA